MEDGRLRLDNNLSEAGFQVVGVGRRNWLSRQAREGMKQRPGAYGPDPEPRPAHGIDRTCTRRCHPARRRHRYAGARNSALPLKATTAPVIACRTAHPLNSQARDKRTVPVGRQT
ncbi:MAG: hypothetical protein HS116_06415 [Planctomycetes bacterium]|nr:hypothetical protein [Planctomycetota bacterium]